MNNTQRLAFWKTLCSLDGKNPENDCKLLSEKITFPRYLYRYRCLPSSSSTASTSPAPYSSFTSTRARLQISANYSS